MVHTSARIDNLVAEIRSVLRQLDASIPLAQVEAMADIVTRQRSRFVMLAVLLTVFGGVALTLALVGLYGVIAYAVSRARREIAIRIAVGAPSRHIVRQEVGRGVWLIGIGVLLGLGGAVALSRLLASQLFGISPDNVAAYLVASIALVTVALVATWLPARGATRVDPMSLLRMD